MHKPIHEASEKEWGKPRFRAFSITSAHTRTTMKTLMALLLSLVITGCASVSKTPPPADVENLCSIFHEKDGWYQDVLDSSAKWGAPPHVMMSIVRYESRFVDNARPPRKTFLGVIPLNRPTTAYGYCQAVNGTWEDYLEETGNYSAERINFRDAIDFVGWYTNVSYEKLGISKADGYNQYLAYHEGHIGFSQQSYLKKKWLMRVAKKVQSTADIYAAQLSTCREELEMKMAHEKATAKLLDSTD